MREGNEVESGCRKFGGACLAGALLIAVFFASFASFASPITVRTQGDMRLWQTVFDRSRALSWPWEDGAEFAALDFSNRLTKAATSVIVRREEGDVRGYHHFSVPGEALVDATLVQLAATGEGEETVEISRDTATLAYVPNAGGGPITVRVKGTDGWRNVRKARIVAFDPAWQGLSGDSGYRVQLPIFPGFVIRIR